MNTAASAVSAGTALGGDVAPPQGGLPLQPGGVNAGNLGSVMGPTLPMPQGVPVNWPFPANTVAPPAALGGAEFAQGAAGGFAAFPEFGSQWCAPHLPPEATLSVMARSSVRSLLGRISMGMSGGFRRQVAAHRQQHTGAATSIAGLLLSIVHHSHLSYQASTFHRCVSESMSLIVTRQVPPLCIGPLTTGMPGQRGLPPPSVRIRTQPHCCIVSSGFAPAGKLPGRFHVCMTLLHDQDV